jgi:hypothetical protein
MGYAEKKVAMVKRSAGSPHGDFSPSFGLKGILVFSRSLAYTFNCAN